MMVAVATAAFAFKANSKLIRQRGYVAVLAVART
jgi:hypothetical protein